MTINAQSGKVPEAFSTAYFNALIGALADSSDAPWKIVAGPDEAVAGEQPDPIRLKLKFEGSLQGEALLEFDRTEAEMLASKVLRRSAGESGIEDSEALLRLVKSGLREFRSALATAYGTFSVEASVDAETAPAEVAAVQITAADDASNRATVAMYLDREMGQCLNALNQPESADEDADQGVRVGDVEVIPPPVNLGLVMDVELNVTLRFGRRQLTLREVLELTSGSVVELDRQVEEPVELLLDGEVIARGEAVVIDGNYGFRVTEVIQPVHSTLVA
jgi:flagellar motor switch protein FliN/FliY